MIAQEMADNRQPRQCRVGAGLLAPRPDRSGSEATGRIDLKVPILPTANREQSRGLIAALAKRYELNVTDAELQDLLPMIPAMMTPGAAEALVVKAYRVSRTEAVAPAIAMGPLPRGLPERHPAGGCWNCRCDWPSRRPAIWHS